MSDLYVKLPFQWNCLVHLRNKAIERSLLISKHTLFSLAFFANTPQIRTSCYKVAQKCVLEVRNIMSDMFGLVIRYQNKKRQVNISGPSIVC